MFTGIVEGRGTISRILTEGAGVRLVVAVPKEMAGAGDPPPGCRTGDSVALNGCCLTVVELAGNEWSFQAGPETLARTNLGELEPGDEVNLERSLPVNGRLGGHFVQGHIDGVGEVASIQGEGEWITMRFRVPERLTRQMVPKGSVAVDGVSLTLVDVVPDTFSIALIPHTLEATTLGVRQVGDRVNIETDILGKYVEKLCRPDLKSALQQTNSTAPAPDPSLEDVMRITIVQTLKRVQGNRTQAAKLLGISVRTLQRRLRDWELEPGSEDR